MTDRPRVSLLCLNGQHETCPGHAAIGHPCGCPDASHTADRDIGGPRDRMLTKPLDGPPAFTMPPTEAHQVDPFATSPARDAVHRLATTAVCAAGPTISTSYQLLPAIKTDPDIPPGVVELRLADGTTVGRFTIGDVEPTPPPAEVALTSAEVKRLVGAHMVLRPETMLATVRDIIRERLTHPEGAPQ